MKYLKLFEEFQEYSYSVVNVEDFDEEYQAYEFLIEDGTKYVILIEDIRMYGMSRYFVRFRPKNPSDVTFIDFTNKGNVIKILNTVWNTLEEYSKRFNITTFYFSPSTEKRMILFIKMLDRKKLKYEIVNEDEKIIKFELY